MPGHRNRGEKKQLLTRMVSHRSSQIIKKGEIKNKIVINAGNPSCNHVKVVYMGGI